MNLLHQLRTTIESARRAPATVRELSRLDDRTLADIGVERADIRRSAWRAARLSSGGSSRAAAPAAAAPARLVLPAVPPPHELDRLLLQARRMRAEVQVELLRGMGRRLARRGRAVARPVARAADRARPAIRQPIQTVEYGQAWG